MTLHCTLEYLSRFNAILRKFILFLILESKVLSTVKYKSCLNLSIKIKGININLSVNSW